MARFDGDKPSRGDHAGGDSGFAGPQPGRFRNGAVALAYNAFSVIRL